jgi:hypothetical protein
MQVCAFFYAKGGNIFATYSDDQVATSFHDPSCSLAFLSYINTFIATYIYKYLPRATGEAVLARGTRGTKALEKERQQRARRAKSPKVFMFI